MLHHTFAGLPLSFRALMRVRTISSHLSTILPVFEVAIAKRKADTNHEYEK
jgi:hypothetical protein